jgi:hypothetical protein
MKALFRILATSAFVFSLVSVGQSNDQLPHPIDVLPGSTFAPPGFDDNDNAQVLLQGNYISSCFRMGNAVAQVDQVNKRIRIRSRTLYYRSSWCLTVLVPYLQPVDLGVLTAGTYDVQVADPRGRWHSMARLPIAVARTASPDEFLYASVTDVELESRDLLRLRGAFPDGCLSMSEVMVLYRSPNIIEVLPKATRAPGRPCTSVMVPFQTRVRLESPWRGMTLIHVRTMNGQALNRAAEF